MASEEVPPIVSSSVETVCPCCGTVITSVDKDVVGFDYMRGVIFKGDKRAYIPPREADFLKVLLEAWPNILSKETMLRKVYGADYFYLAENGTTARVMIKRIRAKLAEFSIDVECLKDRGFWLVRSGQTVSPRRAVGSKSRKNGKIPL